MKDSYDDNYEDAFSNKKIVLESRAGQHLDWSIIYGIRFAFENDIDVDVIHNEKTYTVKREVIKTFIHKYNKSEG